MAVEKKKEYKIVIGSLYGDEGKGVTVQWLCKKELDEGKKPLVVRYSGGAQAAHTIMQKLDNGNILRHVCSSLGSGVLLGVDTYLDENFFLDPIMLMEEIDVLQIELAESGSSLGKSFHPKVWINDWCRVVTPYDVIANRKDVKILSDGTCGKGIFTTCRRYSEQFHMNPLKKVSMRSKELTLTEIFKNPQAYLDKVKKYYDIPASGDLKDLDWKLASDLNISTIDELDWKFCDAITRITRLMKSPQEYIKLRDEDFRRSGLYDTIIYESSQGLLLDAHHGFDPFTTSSLVGLNGLPASIVSNPDPEEASRTEVYLVTRTFLTRHGMGTSEAHIRYVYGDNMFSGAVDDEYEYNEDNDFQKHFHKAVYDTRLFYRALDRHCMDNYKVRFNLVITHADAIDRFIKNTHADYTENIKMPQSWNWNNGKVQDYKYFPVIDMNGNIQEVVNIHEFRKVLYEKNRLNPSRCMFSSFWYCDNPFSEFKRC